MSDKVQLSHEDFAKQMFRFGFFYEQIPPCFTSNSFASKHKDVLALLGKRNPVTMPLTISIYKTEESRREISIPNPMSFASTVRCFASNWTKCERFAESPNSHSPITFIHSYPDPEEGFTVSKLINSENHRTHLNARSDFVNNLKERVLVSLGLPYKLSIDIASFYDSIYTHSISWALCGKMRRSAGMPLSKTDRKPHVDRKNLKIMIFPINLTKPYGVKRVMRRMA